MKHIQASLVVTTSHAPTEVLRQAQGNMIEHQVIGHMLKGIGIEHNKWLNYGGVQQAGEQEWMAFAAALTDHVCKL